VNIYHAKAFECLSLAECRNNPEERAEMVRFARVWMSFAEPITEAGVPMSGPAVLEGAMNTSRTHCLAIETDRRVVN
jgi:hypothetical protein